jgi:hypothetical protein
MTQQERNEQIVFMFVSEEDLRRVIMQAFLSGVERIEDYSEVEYGIIQSLKQSKTPKWFVANEEYIHDDSVPYPKTKGTK